MRTGYENKARLNTRHEDKMRARAFKSEGHVVPKDVEQEIYKAACKQSTTSNQTEDEHAEDC